MISARDGNAKVSPLDKKQGLIFQPLCNIQQRGNAMEVNVKCQDCANWYKTGKIDHCKDCPLKNKKD